MVVGYMWLVGGFHAIAGLVSLLNDNFYVDTSDYFLELSITAWGWVHLVAGVLVFFAGTGLIFGRSWARGLAIVIAALSVLANFAWLPRYPVWAMVMITINVFVIWALTVHGTDAATAWAEQDISPRTGEFVEGKAPYNPMAGH